MSESMTQGEMIKELWRQVCGNGSPGLIERFEDHVRKDTDQQAEMVTALNGLAGTVANLSGKVEGHMDTSRPSTKQITKRRVIEILVGTGTVAIVLGVFVLIAIGSLSASDIAQILQALPGGGP